jgi:hypothetical protein
MLFWVLALPFVLLALLIGGALAPTGLGVIALAVVVVFFVIRHELRRRGSASLL